MALTQQFQAGTDLTATKLNESSIPVVSSTSDISAPFAGQIIFNTTDTRLYRYTGSTWVVFTGGPTWSLTRNSAQAMATNGHRTILWNNELTDTGNMHSNVTNPGRVTINQAGLYAVAAKGTWEPNATGVRGVKLALNGVGLEGSAVINAPVSGFATAVVMPTLYVQCIVGDYLEFQQYHNNGGSLNTATGSSEDYPVFAGTWLRD
jgi:Tfp pilus assembly protein PilW